MNKKLVAFFTIGATVGVALSVFAQKLWNYNFTFDVDPDDPEFNEELKSSDWVGQD